MGRPAKLPCRQLLVRVPEELFAEVVLLNPQMQDETGFLRYGALSQYVNGLLRQNVKGIKDRLKKELQNAPR